ncbi:MAG: FIST C-terminal domain-containing protein [Nitrospinota bacterium]|nr:FIST C-terminal domain-containing protein [Nitrospinota bacterium]
MKTEQLCWTLKTDWDTEPSEEFKQKAQLVFVFGSRSSLENKEAFDSISRLYPTASIAGCSTSGEIQGAEVLENSLIATAIIFDHTRVQLVKTNIKTPETSLQAGETLSRSLEPEGLKHVVVFADGLRVNGTDLVEGFKRHLPKDVRITGGLAGDGELFEKTLICCDGPPQAGQIVAIGFYGSRFKVGYGSLGGWVPFGTDRLITKSKNNVLYELDGQPAVDLYRSILKEESAELSSARFHFPLEIWSDDRSQSLVRTIVAVDEKNNGLVFAGDVPEGHRARLMKVNFNRLMEGANTAARTSRNGKGSPPLALLVSCVGRKIVLKQRTFQELEAVQEVFGNNTALMGFYSYGEIAPFAEGQNCHLHNETMTVTTFYEE